MAYTIDTSVWVSALLKGEPYHKETQAFLTAAIQQQEDIILPVTVPIELVMTLVRRDELETATKVLEFLSHISSLRSIEITNKRLVSIVATAAPLKLRGMDAIVAAVAYEYGCRLVTLDQELARKASSLVEIVNLGG